MTNLCIWPHLSLVLSPSQLAGCLMKLFGRVPFPPSPPRPVPYRPRRPLPAPVAHVRDREIGHAFSASVGLSKPASEEVHGVRPVNGQCEGASYKPQVPMTAFQSILDVPLEKVIFRP